MKPEILHKEKNEHSQMENWTSKKKKKNNESERNMIEEEIEKKNAIKELYKTQN